MGFEISKAGPHNLPFSLLDLHSRDKSLLKDLLLEAFLMIFVQLLTVVIEVIHSLEIKLACYLLVVLEGLLEHI